MATRWTIPLHWLSIETPSLARLLNVFAGVRKMEYLTAKVAGTMELFNKNIFFLDQSLHGLPSLPP